MMLDPQHIELEVSYNHDVTNLGWKHGNLGKLVESRDGYKHWRQFC